MTIPSSSQLPPKIIKLKQTGTQHSLIHTHTYTSVVSAISFTQIQNVQLNKIVTYH